MISLKPRYLARYASVAKLLVKHGRGDLARQIGLEAPDVAPEASHNGKPTPQAESLADDLERLGPTFIKLGQLFSTRTDFLPPDYVAALERLQDDVEPLPYEFIHETIESELGVRISRAFPEFEQTAFAVASIGQVHRATLRDGRRVVVKVQRPGLKPQVVDDLNALQELASVLDAHTESGRRVRYVQMIESLRDVMMRELDYRQEAENGRTLRANLSGFEIMVVPQIHDDYTSEKVITLDYVEGAKITDLSPAVLLELNRPVVADQLFRVYLHQVLVNGVFHADPHPGNLILTPDRRIALIDFGMVARVTPDLQRHLVKLVMALADGRAEEAAVEALAVGRPYEGETFREGEFRERVAKVVATFQGKPLARIDSGRMLMELNGVGGETGLKFPSAMLMLGKTLMNLDKVVMVLDPEFHPNAALQRYAGEIFRRHGAGHWSLGRVYQTALDSAEFMERLPGRLNKFADLLADNKLRLNVDAIDEHKLITGLQKIANRITAGLILAAMIVGAALMMHLDVRPRVFGYPLIAMLFFVLAAAASFILLWRMAFHDEPEEK